MIDAPPAAGVPPVVGPHPPAVAHGPRCYPSNIAHLLSTTEQTATQRQAQVSRAICLVTGVSSEEDSTSSRALGRYRRVGFRPTGWFGFRGRERGWDARGVMAGVMAVMAAAVTMPSPSSRGGREAEDARGELAPPSSSPSSSCRLSRRGPTTPRRPRVADTISHAENSWEADRGACSGLCPVAS